MEAKNFECKKSAGSVFRSGLKRLYSTAYVCPSLNVVRVGLKNTSHGSGWKFPVFCYAIARCVASPRAGKRAGWFVRVSGKHKQNGIEL
jgi:hypothetical protein